MKLLNMFQVETTTSGSSVTASVLVCLLILLAILIVFCILSLILDCIFDCAGLIDFINDVVFDHIGVLISIYVIIAAIVGTVSYFHYEPKQEARYEVILDESYPAVELLEKYEVIEIRGEIYVLKEK